jgi:transcriptional regulator with XRE-family HTH domain
MPKQRRLFADLREPEQPIPSDPLLPERTKNSFYEVLKPITRDKSFRAVARLKQQPPILVCIERIREAKRLSGLTAQDIADLTGIKSRQTVAKVLTADPSAGLYNFCAVMNVLGLDIAELFPMRKRKPASPLRWPRGYVDAEQLRKPDVKARGGRAAHFRRKRWG